jgi:predicted secreted protein
VEKYQKIFREVFEFMQKHIEEQNAKEIEIDFKTIKEKHNSTLVTVLLIGIVGELGEIYKTKTGQRLDVNI